MSELDRVTVDFMFVADAAQSMGGKVHALGGGWTHLGLQDFPARPDPPFNVVVGLRIPWGLTNTPFGFALQLVDEDGQPVEELVRADNLEQGRPPGLRPGAAQRLIFAVPVRAEFPRAGRYRFEAEVDGTTRGETAIEVVLQPLD